MNNGAVKQCWDWDWWICLLERAAWNNHAVAGDACLWLWCLASVRTGNCGVLWLMVLLLWELYITSLHQPQSPAAIHQIYLRHFYRIDPNIWMQSISGVTFNQNLQTLVHGICGIKVSKDTIKVTFALDFSYLVLLLRNNDLIEWRSVSKQNRSKEKKVPPAKY